MLNLLKETWNTSKGFTLMFIFVTGLFTSVSAQETETEEDEELQREKLTIVKAYTPTISDAFKVKSTPKINDSVTQNKKPVRYSIFSVPVASTFTPAKGQAENIEKPKPIPLYDNYATLGFGNYTSALAEFYSNFQINRSDNAGVYLHHNSSQGGIDDVVLDDKFYNTFLDLNYTSRTRDFTYGFEVGAEHQLFNWYGLPEIPVLTEEQINAIDPVQNYLGVKLGGKFEFKDLYFKKVAVNYRYFTDDFKSKESQFNIKPNLEFGIADELVSTDFIVDFVKGSFERETEEGLPRDYQILNLGIQPNVVVLRDNLTLNLGGLIMYSVDNKREENKLYIYPKVTASYGLLNDAVIAYAGAEGGLEQNSYRNAVQNNPYVSPTLEIRPTHNQLDAYVGFKGRISELISYNFRGSVITEDNKPLFVNNRPTVLQLQGFDYGNSFSYRYDDLTTVAGYGELNFTLSKKFNLGITAEYFDYGTDTQKFAWNLPEVKVSVFSDYQISERWFAGAQVFYVGERYDIETSIIEPFDPADEAFVTLDSYLDANINIGYRFNEQLSVFLKGNNLLGDTYERWSNFPVQGLQVLG